MPTLHHDIETRSPVDLLQCGVYVYAADPLTEVLILSWALDDEPPVTWNVLRGDPIPRRLYDAFIDPSVKLAAHNHNFESTLSRLSPLRKQNYLPREVVRAIADPYRWDCTAARAAAYGLPRTLEAAGRALGLKVQKDLDGSLLMRRMCRPNRMNHDGSWGYLIDDEMMERLSRYCEVDVEAERGIDHACGRLSPDEHAVWIMTERLNNRGIAVDRHMLEAMLELVPIAEGRVNERLAQLTYDPVTKTSAVEKVTEAGRIKQWLIGYGLQDLITVADPKHKGKTKLSIGKHVIVDMLAENAADEDTRIRLPAIVREVLIARQLGGKSSASKYKAISKRISADSRVRGTLVYCGAASTMRFSSRGTQTQNLPRGGTIKTIDDAVEDVLAGTDIDTIEMLHGPAMIVASELIRPTFVAAPGHWLARGDYAQIEIRMNAWLAGETRVLQAFRDFDTILGHDAKGKPTRKGPDIYRVAAADNLGVPIESLTDAQRQSGKVSVLACVAEGELVRTHHGLVPIQQVTRGQKVWDGEHWVAHGGVIFKGHLMTMVYGGLRATPDHLVYLATQDDPVELVAAARAAAPLRQTRLWAADPVVSEPHGGLQVRPVYDIVDAGPLNRFTVSGRLVHNCGFQGGYRAIQSMARMFGLKLTDERAEAIKVAWRLANPAIVAFWWNLHNASMRCMEGRPGEKHSLLDRTGERVRNDVWFQRTDRCMALRRPSGRCNFYWWPKLDYQYGEDGKVKLDPYGRERREISYWAEDSQTRQFSINRLYGGLLAENIIQAAARDIMADALVRMDNAGMRPVLTVHDEGICELPMSLYPRAKDAAEAVRAEMARPIRWAPDLPIAVDASANTRYVKS